MTPGGRLSPQLVVAETTQAAPLRGPKCIGVLQSRSFFNPFAETHTLHHRERKKVMYTPEQYYDMVIDVKEYKRFLPWCQESRIVKAPNAVNGEFLAELEVGFRLFTERYTSVVKGKRPSQISVAAADSSTFEKLVNTWKFHPGPEAHTSWLEFNIEFKFRSQIHQQAAGFFLQEVAQAMVSAFDKRALQIYGSSLHVTPAVRSGRQQWEEEAEDEEDEEEEPTQRPASRLGVGESEGKGKGERQTAPASTRPPSAARPLCRPEIAHFPPSGTPGSGPPPASSRQQAPLSQDGTILERAWPLMLQRAQQLEKQQLISNESGKILRRLIRARSQEAAVAFLAYDPAFGASDEQENQIMLVQNLQEIAEDHAEDRASSRR